MLSSGTFDPVHYKRATTEQWQAAAEAWNRRSPTIERWLGPATAVMLDLAGVREGSRVLDVAAGAGGQTLAAAARVGATGRVLATDVAPAILALAEQNTRRDGLTNVATRLMDGEDLDVEPGHFDAVISRVGLIYFPDQQRALRGMLRALRPSGRAAAIVYSTPDRNSLCSVPVSVIRDRVQLPRRPRDSPDRSASARPASPSRHFRAAGFVDVVAVRVDAPLRLPTGRVRRPVRAGRGRGHRTRRPAMTVTVAAVQATPVFLDTEATTAKACSLIKDASAKAARLIVFPEAFIPTYPDWVWRLPAWNDGPYIKRLYEQAVAIPGPVTDQLGEAARDAGAVVAIGVNEIDGGTLYNTLLYLDADGCIAGRHRKLMPTGGERTVWGYSDGSTLDVVRTEFGVVGGLICWENYMPPARAALYAQGVDIYLAPTWDNSDTWIATLRHIAKEGGVHVIGVAQLLRGSDVPTELRGDIYGGYDDWMSRGHTTIVDPSGDPLAGPLLEKEDIIYATIDVEHARVQRRMFDAVGHYARPTSAPSPSIPARNTTCASPRHPPTRTRRRDKVRRRRHGPDRTERRPLPALNRSPRRRQNRRSGWRLTLR